VTDRRLIETQLSGVSGSLTTSHPPKSAQHLLEGQVAVRMPGVFISVGTARAAQDGAVAFPVDLVTPAEVAAAVVEAMVARGDQAF